MARLRRSFNTDYIGAPGEQLCILGELVDGGEEHAFTVASLHELA